MQQLQVSRQQEALGLRQEMESPLQELQEPLMESKAWLSLLQVALIQRGAGAGQGH